MNFNKLYKLKKMLNLFAEETTVDGKTITYNGELVTGIEIFIIDENGEPVIAPNGTYETESKIIIVEDGKVASIEEKTNEENIEENLEENVENENLEELKNKIAELEAKLAEKEAEIEQLKKTIETLQKQVEETVDKPVDEVENQFSKQITFLETVRNKMKK